MSQFVQTESDHVIFNEVHVLTAFVFDKEARIPKFDMYLVHILNFANIFMQNFCLDRSLNRNYVQ